MQKILLALAIALVVSLTAVTPAVGDGWSPWDFSAIYTINDATGDLSFQKFGQLTEGFACPTEWAPVSTVSTPTADGRHVVHIDVSNALGQYKIEERHHFISTTKVMGCTRPVMNMSLPVPGSCLASINWGPKYQAPSDPLADAGWNAQAGPPTDVARGLQQEKFHEAALKHAAMRLRFGVGVSPGEIPFTGRLYFSDPLTGNDTFSRTFLAGICLPYVPQYTDMFGDGQASPGGCCYYDPSRHLTKLAPRATPFSAPPLGSWKVDLEVCNTAC